MVAPLPVGAAVEAGHRGWQPVEAVALGAACGAAAAAWPGEGVAAAWPAEETSRGAVASVRWAATTARA